MKPEREDCTVFLFAFLCVLVALTHSFFFAVCRYLLHRSLAPPLVFFACDCFRNNHVHE